MRNILTEPIASLRRFAPKMSSRQLVSFIRSLQRIMNENGKKASVEYVSDIMRRQAIFEKELVIRGYLKQGKDNQEYMDGVYKAEKVKRVF